METVIFCHLIPCNLWPVQRPKQMLAWCEALLVRTMRDAMIWHCSGPDLRHVWPGVTMASDDEHSTPMSGGINNQGYTPALSKDKTIHNMILLDGQQPVSKLTMQQNPITWYLNPCLLHFFRLVQTTTWHDSHETLDRIITSQSATLTDLWWEH